jgi:hypothetical protein
MCLRRYSRSVAGHKAGRILDASLDVAMVVQKR